MHGSQKHHAKKTVKVACYVPIKLNNQRLPGKNIKLLNGKPLCEYLFSTLCQVNNIDEKYVFCSDPAIIPYMPSGLTFLRRDERLNGPEVKNLEIIEAFVKQVDADIYMLAHVTSPFLKQESMQTAIDKVINGGYDSALSVVEIRSHCWYEKKPLNFDPQNVANTQELEPILSESVGFYIFRKEVFTEKRQRTGNNPYLHLVDAIEGIDIDTEEDFYMAEACIHNKVRKREENEKHPSS